MKNNKCKCGFCNPEPGKQYDPKYGFDIEKMKKTQCLICRVEIGESKYVLEAGLARFGTMFVLHDTCAKEINHSETKFKGTYFKDLSRIRKNATAKLRRKRKKIEIEFNVAVKDEDEKTTSL